MGCVSDLFPVLKILYYYCEYIKDIIKKSRTQNTICILGERYYRKRPIMSSIRINTRINLKIPSESYKRCTFSENFEPKTPSENST